MEMTGWALLIIYFFGLQDQITALLKILKGWKKEEANDKQEH